MTSSGLFSKKKFWKLLQGHRKYYCRHFLTGYAAHDVSELVVVVHNEKKCTDTTRVCKAWFAKGAREADRCLTCASGWLNTSWLVTEATRQKRLHLVVLMCMMGDPGSRNLFHLKPEVRVKRVAETVFSGGEDDDGDDDGEEGGNRGDRRSVAFPRVTDWKEVIDAP